MLNGACFPSLRLVPRPLVTHASYSWLLAAATCTLTLGRLMPRPQPLVLHLDPVEVDPQANEVLAAAVHELQRTGLCHAVLVPRGELPRSHDECERSACVFGGRCARLAGQRNPTTCTAWSTRRKTLSCPCRVNESCHRKHKPRHQHAAPEPHTIS